MKSAIEELEAKGKAAKAASRRLAPGFKYIVDCVLIPL